MGIDGDGTVEQDEHFVGGRAQTGLALRRLVEKFAVADVGFRQVEEDFVGVGEVAHRIFDLRLLM